MNKVYVDVVAEFSKEGCLIPILFVWEDGRKYKIDKVLKIERCASRKAGGVGTISVSDSLSFSMYADSIEVMSPL